MNFRKIGVVALCVAVLGMVGRSAAAAAEGAVDEAALVAALQGNAEWQQKDAASRVLRQRGTVACIPGLAALLPNAEVSHLARYALEGLPFPEAGQALRDALAKTQGGAKAGIITSLGVRRDKDAVSLIIPSVRDGNTDIARAAIGALGRIATVPAAKALLGFRRVPDTVRPALGDALLCAGTLLTRENGQADAARIFAALSKKQWPVYVRMGALRGLAKAQPGKAPKRLIDAMKGENALFRGTAAQIVAETTSTELTSAFVDGLKILPAAGQVAMLRGLAGRADKAAAPAVAAMLAAPEKDVRLAAINTLAVLGGGPNVAALAGLLHGDDPELVKAAFLALAALRGNDINPAIATAFANAPAAGRTSLLDILADRRAEQTVPLAVESLGAAEAPVRIAALRALAMFAGDDHVACILAALAKAADDSERAAAEKALSGVGARCGEGMLPALLEAMPGATAESHIILLHVVAKIGGAKALAAVHGAMSDARAPIAEEAVRLLSEWPAIDAAPLLLELAKSEDLARQVLGLRGYVRLAGTEAALDAKCKMLEEAMALAKRPEEQKIVLGGWGAVPAEKSLDVLMPYLENTGLQNEAAVAITGVAVELGKKPELKPRAAASLKAVSEKAADSGIRERAAKALASLP